MSYCFNLSVYIRYFFVKVLLLTNENISDELIFSDVYRSVNCTGFLAKFTRSPSESIHFARTKC